MKPMSMTAMLIRVIILLVLSGLSWAGPIPAFVDWGGVVELGTPVSGRLERVTVTAGEAVRKGQLLAKLDTSLFQAEVDRATAQLESARARYEDVKRAFERAKDLYERTVLSQTDLQTAEVDFQRAEGAFRRAEAAQKKARVELGYAAIRAPFSGVVIDVLAHPGEVVINRCQPEPVLRLARKGKWVARAHVSDSAVGGIRLGHDAEVVIAGKRYPGKVRKLAPGPDGVDVAVVFKANEGVMAGRQATIEIPKANSAQAQD